MKKNSPIIEIHNLTAGDFRRKVLFDLEWTWNPGEVWAITGPSGAGKSALAALVIQELLVYQGDLQVMHGLTPQAWVGFEPQRRLLEKERHEDTSDISDAPDPGTLLGSFIGPQADAQRFGLETKLQRGMKNLSTGELRRAFFARLSVSKEPLWLLDDPYEGVDKSGVPCLLTLIEEKINQGFPVLFFSRRKDDFPSSVTHIWELQDGRTVYQGPIERWNPQTDPNTADIHTDKDLQEPKNDDLSKPLVLDFQQINAGYRDTTVLNNFTWQVRQGQHWLVRGPNGCGKSTLLSLISGDHPQAFQTGLKIFGMHRGSELTWDELHKRVALLSYAIHNSYRSLFSVSLLDVVAASFQGSQTPTRLASWDELAACRKIMADMNLPLEALWDEVSWGEQRLALLARILVRGTELLLLDEPCQGLDQSGELRFQKTLVSLALQRGTTVIYVTHREEEKPFGDFKVLDLGALGQRS